jgi:hypothetical protein
METAAVEMWTPSLSIHRIPKVEITKENLFSQHQGTMKKIIKIKDLMI